jgi:hypothetical protein
MTSVAFLPWLRQGAAAAVTAPDTLGSEQSAVATLNATVTISGAAPAGMTLQLRGPGDVAGLDPGEIVRREPPPGTTSFEPNHLAYVDFDRPDLPWLFTPAAATPEGRLRPWLCLVVVRVQDGVSLGGPGGGPLPVLQIGPPARPADELPDLHDCWAWAHAQVAGGEADAATVRAALTGPADVSLSRLLCPRLLQPDTSYLACLVPVFDVGRRAGLGLDIPDGDLTGAAVLAFAWNMAPAAPASVTLPVYAQWGFATGPAGDFASLAGTLRVQPAPGGLGTRPADVSHPGFAVPAAVPPGTTIPLEGALLPMTTSSAPWSGPAADAFRGALQPIVNAAGHQAETDPTVPPLLAPPLYGRWQAGRAEVSAAGTTWFDQLNLDPRRRVAAAFGTRVVQEHADAFVTAAWEQAGDLERANRRLHRLQLSLTVGTSLHARTFARLTPEAALRVAAPLFGRIRVTAAQASGGTVTLAARLADVAGPLEATSSAMRRLGRERGPLTRRVLAQGLTRSATSWVGRIFQGVDPVVTPQPYQLMTISSLRERLLPSVTLRRYADVTAVAVAAMGPLPGWHTVPEGQPVPIASVPPAPVPDSPSAAAFRAAARAHLTLVDPARSAPLPRTVPLAAMDDVHAAVVAQLEPVRTVPALAADLVAPGPRSTAPASSDSVDPLLAAPGYPQPMYEPLRDLSPALLLPGLDQVQPNRVVGLQTNQPFVESYLAGLNVELGRELVWRGYPTDQRATYAAQFWDTRGSDAPRADITALTSWSANPLGGNAPGPAVPDPFVLLVRSDLLRRYPNATIYAARAVLDGTVRVPSANPADELMPAFRGSLPPDVVFFGFALGTDQVAGTAADPGWFVVIQEHAGEPRFGLDVGLAPAGAAHLDAMRAAPAGLATGGLEWGRNGAHMAGILRRRPVRIAVHASQLRPPG